MVQNPKGGGLSSTFGSSSAMGGVQKTTDFLDKSTWILAASLIALVLLSSLSFPGMVDANTDSNEAAKTEAPAKTAEKSTPVTTPVAPVKK